MNLDTIAATIAILLVGYLLVRWLSLRTADVSQNLILVMGLFSGTGVLMAMGSPEMAGRYGLGLVTALVASTLVFMVSPLIFYPIRRLSEFVRFATPVDFLTFRYRGRAVAILACCSLILASIPLILAQFLAVKSLASHFVDLTIAAPLASLLTAVIVICILFYAQKTGTAYLSWLTTVAGLLLLPALFIGTWAAVQSVFGSFNQMNQWVIESGQQLVVQRTESSMSLFIVFMAASFASPINFSFLMAHNISFKQTEMSAWAFPLIVLLAAFPVFPLLWSGIVKQLNSPLQNYIFALPDALGYPLIATLASIGIALIALSMVCILASMASTLIINSFILERKALNLQPDLSLWIGRQKIIIAIVFMLLCLLLSAISKGQSITDYYLAGFAGLAQLAPGILAVIYLPEANRRGFIIGLTAGMGIWLATIALPLVFGDWQLAIPFTDSSIQIGMQNWGIWAIEALLINVVLSALFSIYAAMDSEQRAYAKLCMADNLYLPARTEIAQKTVAELRDSLRFSLGDTADKHIAEALEDLGLNTQETRPASLRKLRDTINGSLNYNYGILAATKIMRQSQLSVSPFSKGPDDIYLTESILAVQGDQLTGVASELNRLRIHHRDMLNNLPIGVMSVDERGEILKWNQTLQGYTGIPESEAVGSLITDLPNPWRSQLLLFLTSSQDLSELIEIQLDGQTRWYSLQKSTSANLADSMNRQLSKKIGEDLTEEIILLVEEQTEAVLLTKTSIDNQRLASAGRLAAGVAHEIGNPLTGITCLIQDLKRELKTPQTDHYADQILSQTDRINRIIKSLISFTKGGDMDLENPSKVSIEAAVEEAIALLKLDREKTQVNYQCAIERDFSVWADQHQLVQIFVNLLSNARDASAEGDLVHIETEIDKQRAKVTVRDRGQGIPEQLKPHLFEPFVSSKDPGEGAGLGLWIVFNLAEKLGAEIRIESATEGPDVGTLAVLSFALPRDQSKAIGSLESTE